MIKLEKVRVFVERYFQQYRPYCSLGVPCTGDAAECVLHQCCWFIGFSRMMPFRK